MIVGITGASGMLGTALVSRLSKSHEIFATSRSKGVEGKNIEWDCFDLIDATLLNQWLRETRPDIVIHCAAIVNVDVCEGNILLATKLHAETVEVMANYLNSNNGKLIYISTDSVFDGKKKSSYDESDSVSPLNVYAKTKLMGEEIVRSMSGGLVLRTNIVGWTQEGNTSFAEWILKGLLDNTPLNLFHDVYFSPLHVDDLSFIIEKIIKNPIFGLFHCVSDGGISKYDFGMQMAKAFDLPDSNINRISVKEMDFKADRPKNMTLDIRKISSDLEYDFPGVIDVIKLIKCQYDKNNNLLN